MNKCGECKVCCTIFSIPELNKPKNMACENICNGKCSIYNSRPDSCKNFNCLYITNSLKKEMRPDRCGVLIAGFKDIGYKAYRLRDNININVMNIINNIPNIEGIDARL